MIEPLSRPLSTPEPRRVVVVGGGVTGLAAAHAVRKARPDVEVLLFEERGSLGGNIRTEREGDFLIDTGPDSFIRTKPEALELCRELGIESELIETRPEARRVFVAHQGRLVLLPGGMALAVPTRIAPLLETPLLTTAGKVRLLAEPLVPRRSSTADESIADFFERRVGREAAERLAGPLLGGIYAGDVHQLSMRSTFPQLVELEERHGSLLLGLLAAELARQGGGAKPGLAELYTWMRQPLAERQSPFSSFRAGMGRLIEALAAALPAGAIRTGAGVTSLVRLPSGTWHVEAGEQAVTADAVIVAVPAHVAARIVPDPEVATLLDGIRAASTATVFFALDADRVKGDLRASGFIVPAGEAKILASTFISSKWTDRAPAGSALIRAFVGGARDPDRVAGSTDAELVALATEGLEKLVGPLGAPRFTRVHRYVAASPQPVVGHGSRLARIRGRLSSSLPGLHLAGASYDGVGIPDCIRQARDAAAAALRDVDVSR